MSEHALYNMQQTEAVNDRSWSAYDEENSRPVSSGDGAAVALTPNITPTPRRPIANILKDLKEPVHQRHLAQKTLKGNEITYIPWHRACRILDHYTAGFWNYEIKEKTVTGKHFMVTIRLIIHGADGTLHREGTGLEAIEVNSYGDPSSNAEAMAFRRACAKFGLGLHLYEG